MKITINAKTYDLPNELVIHINQQQRMLDKMTTVDCENCDHARCIEELEQELEKVKAESLGWQHSAQAYSTALSIGLRDNPDMGDYSKSAMNFHDAWQEAMGKVYKMEAKLKELELEI